MSTIKKSSGKGAKKVAKKVAKKSSKAAAKPLAKRGAKAPARVAAKAAAKKLPQRAAAKPAARAKTAARTKAKGTPITSTVDFMVHAYAMETEAAERYAEFADAMEMHNNREVAELFRKLSRIEQRHADQIL